jgi:hypothetical protein
LDKQNSRPAIPVRRADTGDAETTQFAHCPHSASLTRHSLLIE